MADVVRDSFTAAIGSDSSQGLQKLSKQLWEHAAKHPDQTADISSRVLRACLAPDDALCIPKVASFLAQLASTCGNKTSLKAIEDILVALADVCNNRLPCVRVRAMTFMQAMLQRLPAGRIGSDLAESLEEVLGQRLNDKDAKARRAAVLALGALVPMLQASVCPPPSRLTCLHTCTQSAHIPISAQSSYFLLFLHIAVLA